jgi:hypothetical protein
METGQHSYYLSAVFALKAAVFAPLVADVFALLAAVFAPPEVVPPDCIWGACRLVDERGVRATPANCDASDAWLASLPALSVRLPGTCIHTINICKHRFIL